MDGVVEIITGRERRRRWSIQDKVRLVAETHEPGSIRAVQRCWMGGTEAAPPHTRAKVGG